MKVKPEDWEVFYKNMKPREKRYVPQLDKTIIARAMGKKDPEKTCEEVCCFREICNVAGDPQIFVGNCEAHNREDNKHIYFEIKGEN